MQSGGGRWGINFNLVKELRKHQWVTKNNYKINITEWNALTIENNEKIYWIDILSTMFD